MLVPNRYGSSNSYRYGFQGQEKDDEIKGEGNSYDFGARMLDPRVGRWFSVDPLAEKMPFASPYNYCLNNPINMVDLDGRIPTPAEAARMAAHVYGDKKNGILTGGWKVSNRDFGIKLQDATGLKSQVYERTVKGKIEYTYATAGTEASLKDIGADLKQPLGDSQQYSSASSNAKKISNILGGTELTFTGHSLGGGEAALNALLTDRAAITFNAAGVGSLTKFGEGSWSTPFKSESKINAYIMSSDPLNSLQNTNSYSDGGPAPGLFMPDVNGVRHILNPTDFSSKINGHSIDNMLKNFGVKDPSKYK